MTKQLAQPANLKEQNATHTLRLTIRDRVHFYKIVNWLNDHVGKGRDKWTMEGRVLRTLNTGVSANPRVYIFTADFDPTAALYLSLI